MRRLWAARGGTRGSAVVEFVLFAVVAIVPLAWAALALQQLVAVHHAAQTAAGESLRAYLTSPSEGMATHRADVAAALVLQEQPGVERYEVAVACDRPRCLVAGSSVAVRVQLRAELPQIPVLGIVPTLQTSAEQYGVVDAFIADR